ncbi:helix-turn-helix transcriptional regulator [Caballeronia sp. GAFFF2]|uniref:helix-turn-helix domain-containing protein n=1 Tax=Caballeronia sp. GAFFF2 TaxID=2921741 RepID=UPI00202974A1
MSTFFERLREERKRLRLNQTDFAGVAGVTKESQLKYENGSRRPDATYLEAIAAYGVDILYILTGRRDVSTLSADETDLVRRYREAIPGVRAAVQAALTAGNATIKAQQDFRGARINQQVSGDVQGPFTINMEMGKSKKKTGD